MLKELLRQCAAETVALLEDQGKEKEQALIEEMRKELKENSVTFDDHVNQEMAKIED